jgi:electron transport complex protein RnfG
MMNEPSGESSYIGQAWLVIFLSLVFGGGLTAVQTTLSPKIAENRRNETYSVVPELVSGADAARTEGTIVKGVNGKEVRVYRALDRNGAACGWVLPAGGQGFGDRIELLIGLDAGLTKITGLYVLEQKETPGLGNYIASPTFRARFQDKSTDRPLVVVKREPGDKSNNEIQAWTGATVSSVSVCDIVNSALANLKEPLRQLGASGGTAAEPTPPAN